MSTKHSNPHEGTDSGFEPSAPGPINTVGIDEAGATHYHAPYADRVWVVQDGQIEREQRLEGAGIHEWIEHVDDVRGWKRNYYYEGEAFRELVAQLVDSLEEDQ